MEEANSIRPTAPHVGDLRSFCHVLLAVDARLSTGVVSTFPCAAMTSASDCINFTFTPKVGKERPMRIVFVPQAPLITSITETGSNGGVPLVRFVTAWNVRPRKEDLGPSSVTDVSMTTPVDGKIHKASRGAGIG